MKCLLLYRQIFHTVLIQSCKLNICHATCANATLDWINIFVDPLKTSEISKLLKNKFIRRNCRLKKYCATADWVDGGARRDRTADLLRARQALSQLSYGPSIANESWWVWVDLNHRPHPYQGCALTNWATDPRAAFVAFFQTKAAYYTQRITVYKRVCR